MPILPGRRLGPYEILSGIGAGGMVEVYRAHDTKLGRDVAIKVLPEAFANDPDRLSHFQREAIASAWKNAAICFPHQFACAAHQVSPNPDLSRPIAAVQGHTLAPGSAPRAWLKGSSSGRDTCIASPERYIKLNALMCA